MLVQLAILFNIVLESVIRKLELRSDISSKLTQINAYADDIALIARTKKALIETFNKISEEAALVGLHINENKTKYIHIQKTGPRNKIPLQSNNYSFEKVNNLIYLGSILNENDQMQFEIAERIRKGNRAYYANVKLLKSKLLKRSTKMRIYVTFIIPVVTYASETWTLTEKDEMRLRIFERQIL
jgi:sorting nexin-29